MTPDAPTPAPSRLQLPAAAQPLLCHPATPCALNLRVSVALAVAGSEQGPGWLLSYHLRGEVGGLRLPEPTLPGPADGLWQHTCFEAFVARAGESAYREFNFSPSGQWAAYRFSAERVRDLPAEAGQAPVVPDLQLETTEHALTLLAWLPHHALPAPAAGQPLQLGLTAVLEDRLGRLSYWALRHPGARPDFHHRDSFALDLLPPLFDPPTASRDTA
ncbi:DOMON-like domain-containing protein [Hydrogenophaga taeniospiralis]|uniref:DOMON-like domain-containing protein n=1 Tax=Hydrogenophaga taeniospiralis TaxID=65656 RepID=UPI000A5F6103|nr:DOMON-like domain-containing protein [Hydrogenophaga taeniospiralis]